MKKCRLRRHSVSQGKYPAKATYLCTMPITDKLMATGLPVVDILEELNHTLANNQSAILTAPPGAGKSTTVPLALLELTDKKIIVLEPRRLAARSIAMRMADIIDEPVGNTVGYRVRFDQRITADTRIEVVTEGILTRMLQSDNALEDVGIIIFDEFHERSLHADLALALCRESQKILRPDLKLLIMSATLDMERLSNMLHCPIVESSGRQHPVTIVHKGDIDVYSISEMVTAHVRDAIRSTKGDILVFLPGQGEISRVAEALRQKNSDVAVRELYGALPLNKQHAAIFPDKDGRRKVVLATSIAETSLTIEGIGLVIDCGYSRVAKYDPASALTRLTTVPVTLDTADQRAGRAGRLGPGTCWRLWSKATELRLDKHRVPEIQEADLTSLTLELANWGINNAHDLLWLTPPPNGAIAQAQDLLHDLEALDNGKITEHGRRMLTLPCPPRLAHMLILAEEDDLTSLACDIAALLEEKDPLGSEAGIDISLRVDELRRLRKENRLSRSFKRIEQVAGSYRQLLAAEIDNHAADPYAIGLILTHAYPDRIAAARPGNNAQFQLANGRLAMAGHRDDLAHEPWLAVAHVDARDGMGKIFMAAPLNPTDLATMVRTREVIQWNHQEGRLIANEEMHIGSLVLKSTPVDDIDDELKINSLIQAVIKYGESLLDITDDFRQVLARIESVRQWNEASQWPESTLKSVLSHPQWLAPYLNQVKDKADFKRLNVTEAYLHSLEYEQQEQLSLLAPTHVEVPSGSSIRLTYRDDGEPPVLAVRIQEVFGMTDTPKVNQGKVAVLMHLLSPGFKPVQVTADLHNFWKDTYFEVRKELKRRYPKHVWPDNPMEEPAIRGVKRKV